jgi:hypothetical protein
MEGNIYEKMVRLADSLSIIDPRRLLLMERAEDFVKREEISSTGRIAAIQIG